MHSELDSRLTRLALRHKNLVVLDAAFPSFVLPQFRQNYDQRLVSIPGRSQLAFPMAVGLAQAGKLVCVLGAPAPILHQVEPSLNIKWISSSPEGDFSDMDFVIGAFGPSLLLIPSEK